MKFKITHTTGKKLESLSERLRYLARSDNFYRNHVDQKIKSENLQFNLSLVISHIILNLKFIDRSKDVFLSIVEEYNRTKKTALTFENFEKINWIRTVADEITIPELVRHFVWKVGYYENEGKSIEIPIDKIDLIRCLQIYYKRCFEDSKLTITKDQLVKILKDNTSSKSITINNLQEKEIIEFDSKSELYFWKSTKYSRHLRNEIASTLWLLIGSEEATILEFRKYYRLISGTQIWVDDLGSYLSYKNTSKICELSVSFLNSESDLLNSDNEFNKIWLDANSDKRIDIKTEIPVIEFNYESAFDFIESVNYHKRRFHDAFDYQSIRSFCHSLLRIIAANDVKHSTKYENILKIIKDTSRPFLLWTLYSNIKKEYPFVIPYLLTDSELVPIAFKLIEEIELDYVFLSEQSNSDREFEERCESKSHLWLEMFDFTLEQLASTPSHDKKKAELLAKILIELSEKVFSINLNNTNNITNHNVLKKRYDEVLKKLSNKRITSFNSYPSPPVSPRLAVYLLPHFINYIKKKFQSIKPSYNEFLHLKSGLIDLSIELLRISNFRNSEGEFSKDQKEKNEKSVTDLISILKSYLSEFYSVINIDVQSYSPAKIKTRKAKRGVNEFGFEIIDWGYLYLYFEDNKFLHDFNHSFSTALNFNIRSNSYDEQNKEQFEKIKLYLKSMMLGFISINQRKIFFELEGLPVKATLNKLEKWIREFSLLYSIDDIPQKRIDVFNEKFSTFGYDMHYQFLTSLLYKSINFFTEEKQSNFVRAFFADSTDIGRMLTAVNILDSKELQSIISKRICNVKIEDFIKNSFTITELKYALVEAVNSTNHWELAAPLLARIQKHFKRVKHNNKTTKDFLFEINLLLAFKEENMYKLKSIAIPEQKYFNSSTNKKGKNLKNLFVALFNLYNEKKYDEAIQILKHLLSNDVKNIRYAFHLYRAETLKAINNNENAINKSKQDWDNFVNDLTAKEKKGLSFFSESIDSNSLHYFVQSKDTNRFDQIISKLSKRYLYNDEVTPLIYNFYIERNLFELAFNYILTAKEYFNKEAIPIPSIIQRLFDNSESSSLLSKYKISLERIRNLTPSKLPKITPDIVNDKHSLGEFILHEFVAASKILIDKIHGIKQITHEDRFNDLLLAILRLRFQIWGWSIHDQARRGSSPTGKSAGETDITIEAGNITISLIEALILKGSNKPLTQKHVLKSFTYAKNLDKYYMIIYFKGVQSKLEYAWKKYKENVQSIAFSSNFKFKKTKGFEDLTSDFEDIHHLRIARTIHGEKIEMFHIMINLAK